MFWAAVRVARVKNENPDKIAILASLAGIPEDDPPDIPSCRRDLRWLGVPSLPLRRFGRK
jgi:hypothetical protein